jgi:long-chain acyl-CoA synthetase
VLDLSRPQSLGDALLDPMVTFKTNVALIESNRDRENGRWTYRELKLEAERFAACLQSRGLEAGGRCAILMSNQARWTISGLGAIWAGATLVPLDYKLKAEEQLALLEHASPQALVTEWPVWKKLQSQSNSALEKTAVFVTEAPDDADLGPAVRWEEKAIGKFHYVERSRDDVACIVYSSGTGGTPKGCMLTHDNYLIQAQALGRLFPLDESDRYFSILPTNHAIDFMCGFLLPLMFGGAVVHQRTLRPQYIKSTMKHYGITHMAVVPLILKALRRGIEENLDELPTWKRTLLDGLVSVNEVATLRGPRHGVSSRLLKAMHDEFGGKLRYLFCGGAFTDRDTAEFFYRYGFPVVIGYGLTEAGTVLTLNDLKPFRGDTVGKAIDGVTLEVRDKNTEGVGEVWIKSATVMKGYLDEPELTDEAIVDGWLRTGDMGCVDAAGHLKLVGRAKNMIVTEGGKNIYPEDIESAFDGVEGFDEFCVFAANYLWPTGKLTGEELTMVLRPKDGDLDSETIDDLKSRNRRLPDFKRIANYMIWKDDFPRTASMKIKRVELARQISGAQERSRALVAL